jgi:hypothetical protein
MPTSHTDLPYIDKYPFYFYGDKIAEICAPLNKFSINYFTYTFIHKDKSIIALTSDKNWVSYFIKSGHTLLFDDKKVHPWSSNMNFSIMKKAAEYNHYNGVFIEKIHRDHVETLEFASSNIYSSPLEFCYNRNLLNQFVLYFKDKAKQLIKAAEKYPLYFPENRQPKLLTQCKTSMPSLRIKFIKNFVKQ